MSSTIRASSMALILASLMLAGCAADGADGVFTTGALATPQTAEATPAPKVDPACITLASKIDVLRKEGIADKIEKAAAKKYKMTNADLAKADTLTKTNAEFQMRCSSVVPSTAAATPPAPRPAATTKAAPKAAAAATPSAKQ